MKMFKRFAAALLAGVMVLAMLTACGGGSGSGASTFDPEVEKSLSSQRLRHSWRACRKTK